MSQAASPTNRGSIFGWVKNIKRPGVTLNDSVNELSENDLATTASKSPSRLLFSVQSSNAQLLPPLQAIPFPSMGKDAAQQSHSHLLDLLRPLLNHKSRSTNNVNRIRSNSTSNQSATQDSFNIRQHRDSFLQNNPLVDENLKYFGVPLADAINEASAKISILGTESSSLDVLQYGRIPIVVAKCGIFLKNSGLTVEGIFRVGGLSKRIKELQIIFSTPPDFGKKLNWDGFTVHDAALVLRRYLNALPEPLISLNLYEDFREPLRTRPRIIKYMKYKAENPRKSSSRVADSDSAAPDASAIAPLDQSAEIPAISDSVAESNSQEQKDGSGVSLKPAEAFHLPNGANEETEQAVEPATSRASGKPKSYKKLTRDVYEAIDDYKLLLDELPGLSKQLLFYILDLLAMVQGNSQTNLMSSRNLAAIFQPSILLHPNHDMDPDEYALSQSVVEFLIQYSYKLLPSSELPKAASSELPAPAITEPPAESNSADESTLKVRGSGRPHSRSLSSPNHDLDLVGYRNSRKQSRGLTLSDSEFVSGASSDDDCGSEAGYGLPKPSAAPNLLHVLDTSAGKDDDQTTNQASGASAPPITISDVSREVGT